MSSEMSWPELRRGHGTAPEALAGTDHRGGGTILRGISEAAAAETHEQSLGRHVKL